VLPCEAKRPAELIGKCARGACLEERVSRRLRMQDDGRCEGSASALAGFDDGTAER
jgi:hypothetical protein